MTDGNHARGPGGGTLDASLPTSDRRSPQLDDPSDELRRELARLRDEVSWLRRDNEALRQALGRRGGGALPAHRADDPEPTGVRLAVASSPLPTLPGAAAPLPAMAPPAPFVPPPLPALGVIPAGQGIDFGAIAQLTPDKLDGLPYGLITLDARGRVIHYNDTESRLVGLPKDRVIGRNFFRDIAPCTRIREFEGRFHALAADPIGVRVQAFDFVFKFARGEQRVSVVMTPGRVRGQFHLALLRRAIAEPA